MAEEHEAATKGWDSDLYTKADTDQDGYSVDTALDTAMRGMQTPQKDTPTPEYKEHWGLDSQGLRTVRYFSGPMPQAVPGENWKKGERGERDYNREEGKVVVPPTPNVS